jgi:hypothetical protein
MRIWEDVGVLPGKGDITSLLPPQPLMALRVHPDTIKAYVAAITGTKTPGLVAPAEFVLGLLGVDKVVSPGTRLSAKASGASATSAWGEDVIIAVTSPGKVLAPRAFITVVSSAPQTTTLSEDKPGFSGRDGSKVADMFTVEVVGSTATSPVKTKSAYIFKPASDKLAVS